MHISFQSFIFNLINLETSFSKIKIRDFLPEFDPSILKIFPRQEISYFLKKKKKGRKVTRTFLNRTNSLKGFNFFNILFLFFHFPTRIRGRTILMKEKIEETRGEPIGIYSFRGWDAKFARQYCSRSCTAVATTWSLKVQRNPQTATR